MASIVSRPNATQTQPSLEVLTEDDPHHEPTNGGLRAYLKVFGGFCVFFMTLGVASTFGAYQAYYQSDLLRAYSSSTISWIGTAQVFLLSFVGMFAGAIFDRGHAKLVLGSGMLFVVLGLFLLSFSRRYWQILLTQGICVGAGSGLIYVPAVSVVSNQFTTKRTVALGMTATGSAVGGVVLPIMFRRLLPSIGFGWTNRVLAFLILFLAVAAFALLTDLDRTIVRQTTRARRSDAGDTTSQSISVPELRNHQSHVAPLMSALRDRTYVFLCVGVFFVFLGYWVPLFYVVPFASLSLNTSSSYASYLLSILNAGSFFGRIIPAYLSQVIGSALVLFAGAAVLAVVVFTWLGIANVPGITVWCILVGFTSGIVVSIPNAVASRLSTRSDVGVRIGVMWTAGAFAELIGAPIAGALVTRNPDDQQDVNYFGGQVFGGLSILLGAGFLAVPAWSIFKDDKLRKARSA